jgi:hypothetical protein
MTLAKYFRYQLKRTMLMLPLVFFTCARIWAQSASTTTMSASATTATWPTDITALSRSIPAPRISAPVRRILCRYL